MRFHVCVHFPAHWLDTIFRGASLSRIGHVTQDHLHSSCKITSTPPAISPPLLLQYHLHSSMSHFWSRVSQGYFKVFQGYFKCPCKDSSKFFQDYSRFFQGSFKALSLLFLGSFKVFSRIFQGSFKVLSSFFSVFFQGCLKLDKIDNLISSLANFVKLYENWAKFGARIHLLYSFY